MLVTDISDVQQGCIKQKSIRQDSCSNVARTTPKTTTNVSKSQRHAYNDNGLRCVPFFNEYYAARHSIGYVDFGFDSCIKKLGTAKSRIIYHFADC